MKAITTLAVLGLAFASERRENPRFRIDHRVINADNNSDVKVVDFNKDFQNTNSTQGATEEDWMKYVPKEFRGLVNTGTVDSKVFTARNNTGTVIIRRDDADDEFGLIDVHNKITNIDANHNSGMMKILNRDEADDEFGLINIHNDIRKINANHNSGMMTILDDADDEFGLIDIRNKITNIDANHNSGMMKILNRDETDDEFTIRSPFHINPDVVYRDDEFAAWNLLESYAQSNQQLGPHTVRTTTKTQTFTAPHNNQGVVIIRDDADDEFGLININNERRNIKANHNSGMMTILDDADNELGLIDIHNEITKINANHNSGMMTIHHDDEDNELAAWNLLETYAQSNQQLGPHTVRTSTKTQTFNAPNNNQGVVIIRDDAADDELGLINIHHEIRNINANHNSGMMTILDDADNELGLINIHHEIRNIDANHNSGMMTILDDADDELAVLGSLLRKDWTI